MQRIKRICNKCGVEQEPDKEKSTKSWNFYTTKDCKCGGEFKLAIDGEII